MYTCTSYQSLSDISPLQSSMLLGSNGVEVSKMCKHNYKPNANCCAVECNGDPVCTQDCIVAMGSSDDLAIPLTYVKSYSAGDPKSGFNLSEFIGNHLVVIFLTLMLLITLYGVYASRK